MSKWVKRDKPGAKTMTHAPPLSLSAEFTRPFFFLVISCNFPTFTLIPVKSWGHTPTLQHVFRPDFFYNFRDLLITILRSPISLPITQHPPRYQVLKVRLYGFCVTYTKISSFKGSIIWILRYLRINVRFSSKLPFVLKRNSRQQPPSSDSWAVTECNQAKPRQIWNPQYVYSVFGVPLLPYSSFLNPNQTPHLASTTNSQIIQHSYASGPRSIPLFPPLERFNFFFFSYL